MTIYGETVIESVSTVGQLKQNPTITLFGRDFPESNATIFIGSSECPTIGYIDSGHLTCSNISFRDYSPYNLVDITIQYNNHTTNQSQFNIFSKPNVTSIEFDGDLVINGIDFYLVEYLTVSLGSTPLNCSNVNDTSIKCQWSNSFYTDILTVIETEGDKDVFYNSTLLLSPYIERLSSEYITTHPQNLTIFGSNFKFLPFESISVYQGQFKIPITDMDLISNDSIVFTTRSGIVKPNEISINIISNNNTLQSNIINYRYYSPAINNVTQDSEYHNRFNLEGFNFGIDSQMVSAKIGNLNVTVLSVDNRNVKIQLPENAKNGELTLIVDDQGDMYPLHLQPRILSFKPLPKITSTRITITGEYLIDCTIFLLVSVNDYDPLLLNCNYSTISYPTTAYCDGLIAGTGKIKAAAKSEFQGLTLTSEWYQSSYQGPLIKSVKPTLIEKDTQYRVTITGDNFEEKSLSVTIGTEYCTDAIYVSPDKILCDFTSTIPQNSITNPMQVQVTVDRVTGFENSTVIYKMKCPNDCSMNGVCDTVKGECQCDENYRGGDCSVQLTPDDSSTEHNPSSMSKLQFSIILISFTILGLLIFM
ncbi:IPT/TIG domain-containing protein [Tieghemostelium lacteum]|uniref:IPT/TIG domain-containing protein n=1 Tax=Tieghemostelium lacteum TaxID=361077 RepID=A0A151ZDM9_TIELA|nr:IPT/TIG domain-containing protein [Tieghemostelium lacteum]|eukprot:KYQ91994.1 IPT/TIG domain-containing protein [Tieghemostelium lacteum]